MLYAFMDKDKYIYHYTKSETAINYILKNRNLKFSLFNETNDPKESKQWDFELSRNYSCDFSGYDKDQLSDLLSLEMQKKTKILCFSSDKDLKGDHLQDIFNRGYCKPRMWAQYADNHRGVCLVFDKEIISSQIDKQFSDDGRIYQGFVNYYDQGIARDIFSIEEREFFVNLDLLEYFGLEKYALEHMDFYHKRLFFEKMIDWRDENEWRYVISTASSNPEYLDYGKSLVGVVFGDRTAYEHMSSIKSLLHGHGIFFICLKWRNSSPWYDFQNRLFF